MIERFPLARAWPLLPGLFALMLYWPARNYGLIWDDHVYLGPAAEFHDLDTLWRWAVTPFFAYFRPLPLFTLGAEQLYASWPYAAHLDQLLLHALNCALVACVAQRALQGANAQPVPPWPPLAAALLYAAHPALTEAAAWLSARFDLMVTTLVLCALLIDRAEAPPRQRAAAVGSVFFLALLCKEMATGLLLVLPIWHLLFEPAELRALPLAARLRQGGNLRVYVAMAIALAAHALLRMEFLGFLTLAPGQPMWSDPLGHLALVCKTLGGFLRLALMPFFACSPVHPFTGPAEFSDPEARAGLGLLVLVPWVAMHALRGHRAALLLICAFASLLPVLNLVEVSMNGNYLHERFMVLPLAFVAMAVAAMLAQARAHRTAVAVGTGLWLLAFAVQAHANLQGWRDDISVWSQAWQQNPASEVAATNLMESYLIAKRYEDVHAVAQVLLQRPGGTLAPYQRLRYAQALASLEKPEAALAQIAAALGAAGDADRRLRARLYTLSGQIFLAHGDLPNAIEHYDRASAYDPEDSDVLFNLAAAIEAQGARPARARQLLERSLKDLDPAQVQRRRKQWAQLVSELSAH